MRGEQPVAYTYDDAFMSYTGRSSRHSATRVIALLRDAVPVASVLDVGCAGGTWLARWQAAGVDDVFGIDGDYVDVRALNIARERFLAADLSRPFDLGRRFDVVQSLEVAEHVPEDCADRFVRNLVEHGNGIIFFSAAPPGQGGEFHVNEQPYDYWRRKFRAHGYEAYDYVRPLLASDKAVSFWYRFNAILYLTAEAARRVSDAVRVTRVPPDVAIADVSPGWFKARKAVVRMLPFGARQALARMKARSGSR